MEHLSLTGCRYRLKVECALNASKEINGSGQSERVNDIFIPISILYSTRGILSVEMRDTLDLEVF